MTTQAYHAASRELLAQGLGKLESARPPRPDRLVGDETTVGADKIAHPPWRVGRLGLRWR